MAQNIAIQEGNQGKQFGHINKLKISNQGGGTSLWVPEDEVRTKSLYVSENGTYLASKDEVYGYDEVTVNIANEVTGWKYDEDTGEIDGLYDIEVDDDDFFIEDDEGEIGEELPTSIKITIPPKRTSYKRGEKIDLTGIEVTAYCYDGSVWFNEDYPDGIIPIEELDFDPKEAGEGSGGHIYEKDGIQAIALDCNIYSDHDQYCRGYHYAEPTGHGQGKMGNYKRFVRRETAGVMWLTNYDAGIYIACPDNDHGTEYICYTGDGMTGDGWNGLNGGRNGYFGVFANGEGMFADILDSIPISEVNPSGKDFSNPIPVGDEVVVTWNCPFVTEVGEEEIDMSDSYEITIVASGSEGHGDDEGDSSGGGSGGGSW